MTTTPAPALLTVGDLNAQSNVPRALMWVVAVYMPCPCIATAAASAYCIYHSSGSVVPVITIAYWLPPLMLWAVYMALVSDLIMYMHLFLPRAPLSVRQALVEVGMCWVGFPLSCVAIFITFLGQPWMAVALSCLMVLLIAGVIALWVRLARTYRTVPSADCTLD